MTVGKILVNRLVVESSFSNQKQFSLSSIMLFIFVGIVSFLCFWFACFAEKVHVLVILCRSM